MIKIPIKKTRLEELAKIQYELIKNNLEKRLGKLINGFRNPVDQSSSDFLQILNKIQSNLKTIITSDLTELGIFLASNPEIANFNYENEFSGKKYKNLILNLFGYKTWRTNFGGEFFSELEIKVCPYCNENYTLSIDRRTKKKALIEFDHFLPKKHFPYFSMSIFNLIPSCSICNRQKLDMKQTKELTEFSPYELINKKILSFIFDQEKFLDDKGKIKIKYMNDNKTLEELYNQFLIEERYNQHIDIANEIKEKSNSFREEYIEDLAKNHGLSYEEIYRYLYGTFFSKKEFLKRPLSKFTRDLIEDLNPEFIKKIEEELTED